MWAVEGGKVNVVTILLEYNVDINIENNDGMTALHWAAQKGDLVVLKLLVEKGAKVDSTDKNGNTPLDLAEIYEHKEIMEYLIIKIIELAG
jgi:ankyrin repeat protein